MTSSTNTTQVEVTLNGTRKRFEVGPDEALLDVLRRHGYTGAKRGCNEGACGFCTIIIDGDPEKSCLIPATHAAGASIETIEGLGKQDELHPVQQAFVDNAALQCGYCIPGMILRAKALLEDKPDPDEAEIRRAISENLCRCTGYEKIITAIRDAADGTPTAVATDGGCTDCHCGGDQP